MEAAGIEPASRDTSDTASTCLATSYFSRLLRSLLASVQSTSLEHFLTLLMRDTKQCDSELRQVVQRLRRALGTWVAYIRQPVRGFPQQLLL